MITDELETALNKLKFKRADIQIKLVEAVNRHQKYSHLKAQKEKLTQEITEKEKQLDYLTSDFFKIFGSLDISIFEEEEFYLNSSIFQVVEKMAMEASKLIDIVDKLIKIIYDGSPGKLSDFIDMVNAVHTMVTHADNQGSLVSLIKLKTTGDAKKAIKDANTVPEITQD
jgi:cell fate (sporulation/competence/biofilm development) regulator YlbF (YheA/YmcA/DUF963 family)